jgi:hypothetical protein
MLQIQLLKRIDLALEALHNAELLIEVLAALDLANDKIESGLLGIAEGGGNKINESASYLHSYLASLPSITRDLNVRKLFNEIEQLQHRLSVSLREGLSDSTAISKLLDVLDAFAEAYNTYIAHTTGVNAINLLFSSNRLKNSLTSFDSYLVYIRDNIVDATPIHDQEAEFSLVLFHVADIEVFSEKLSALAALYAELCFVFDISKASHPLRIAKIESGSLLTKLFGDTKVVGLMVSLVEGSVRYFHRNHTAEGKIAAIPKRIESLNSILDFSNRLKESGVDVSNLQENLAKSAVSIADSLNALVSDQSTVEINGQVFSINNTTEKTLLEQSKMPRLGYQTSDTDNLKLPPKNS